MASYSDIDNSYDSKLIRDGEYFVSVGAPIIGDPSASPEVVKSERDISDLWTDKFIRSVNWKPRTSGFYIDGRTGDAEFNGLVVRGTVFATAGEIGGFTIASNSLSGGAITGSTITGGTITGATVQTALTGFRMKMNGTANSYQFLSGNTVLAEMISTSVPFSGLGGFALKHGTGTVLLDVSGQGEGVGGRQVVMKNSDASSYAGFFDKDDGTFNFEMNIDQFVITGLPTSNPGGSGRVWSDAGTLKIT